MRARSPAPASSPPRSASSAPWQPGIPGTAGGTLSVAGTVSFASSADYLDTINGASASSINISGAATLGGATVTIAAGSTVTTGRTYTIMVAGSLSGTFNPTITYDGDVGIISYVGDDVDLVFKAPCFTGQANSGSVPNTCITAPTITGGVTNTGTISGTGVGILVSGVTSFAGGITNTGLIDPQTGISVSNVSSYSGGILNSAGGTIAASAVGINVSTVSSFTGGISNAGLITITAPGGIGISLSAVQTFTGGNISNSGTISAKTGITIAGSTINGAIFDTGNILASSIGIGIDNASTIVATKTAIAIKGHTFTGGISNAGTISAKTYAIYVDLVTSFGGGISSSGVISATRAAIALSGVSIFSGNISNSRYDLGKNRHRHRRQHHRRRDHRQRNYPGLDPRHRRRRREHDHNQQDRNSDLRADIHRRRQQRRHDLRIGRRWHSGPRRSTFTGSIVNSGTITAKTGIAVEGSTISGAINDSGNIAGSTLGILIDNASTIAGGGPMPYKSPERRLAAASATPAFSRRRATTGSTSTARRTFLGGISNAGKIRRSF